MQAPAPAQWLDLWERGRHRSAGERALQWLALALPGLDAQALAELDLGARDWHLLRLRADWFGPQLVACADCVHCGERLEVELDLHALLQELPAPAAPLFHSRDGHRFRLPGSGDLLAAGACADDLAAAHELFRRCGLDNVATIDDRLFDEVDAGLAVLAEARRSQLHLVCEACSRTQIVRVDAAAFLWNDIRRCAENLLDEVHRLASAYGWSEREILQLGEARRAAYLARVG